MTIAEIHGKISSSGSNISDRREDLLTSDVFGCLRYIPFDKGFQKILTQAQLYIDQKKLLGIDNSDGNVCVEFWPRLENNSEPDVLIRKGDHLIMIEVKYLSGKSGHYEPNQDSEDSMEAASSDQLARLFRGLMGNKGNYPRRSLIYLTAHRILPQNDIEAGCKELDELSDDNRHEYNDNVYWLSWFEVYKTVDRLLDESSEIRDKYWRIVLSDIKELLNRKSLRQFKGFKGLLEKCTPIMSFYKRSLRPIDWNIQSVEPIQQPAFYHKSL